MEKQLSSIDFEYKKSPVDIEFELSDLNGDKKISVEEWRNVFLEGSEEPQNVDEANMEEQSIAAKEEPKPPVPPSPVSPQASSGVAFQQPWKYAHRVRSDIERREKGLPV